MTGVLQDIRFGVRQLKKRLGWSFTIIFVLALAIGANTTMFSAFEAWVLRPLDFAEPERLVGIHEFQTRFEAAPASMSPANLGDLRSEQQSFEDLAAFRRTLFNLSDANEPVRVEGTRISANLLPLLGKQPVLGRGFTASEDTRDQAAPVVLISDQLWRERFGADPDVLGRTVRLDGREHEIIGVMEPGFAFPEWANAWTPLALDEQSGSREARGVNVVARLRDGVSIETAAGEVARIAERLAELYPDTNAGWSATVMPLRDNWVPDVIEVAMMASMGAALLVLIVICANVGSLILARAAARSRETALRTALGASRARLIQQSVVEASLLAVIAGALGIVVAGLGVSAMLSSVPLEPPYLFTMGFSPWAAGYTLLIALLAGLFCGLAPVVRASGKRTFENLKSGRRVGDGAGLSRARSLLVVAELALSTALVIGALLMVKNFLEQQGRELGFETEGILLSELTLTGGELDEPAARYEAGQRIVAGLEGTEAFRAVGLINSLPSDPSIRLPYEAQGRPLEEEDRRDASVHAMTSGVLDVLELPLLSGRNFTSLEDREGGKVALVSRKFGAALWGDADPVGRLLRATLSDEEPWLTVVGVVGDVDIGRDMVTFGDEAEHFIYVPWAEMVPRGSTVVVSGVTSSEVSIPVFRSALRSAVPSVPIDQILTMKQALLEIRWVSRFFSQQLAIYAAFAMLIAAVGLYGLTADSVMQRRHELAVRSVFGARRRDLVGMILRDALVLGVVGVTLGLLLGFATTRFGASMLTEISAQDPVVFIAVALLFLAVTLLAAFLPARRATLLDPSSALRSD